MVSFTNSNFWRKNLNVNLWQNITFKVTSNNLEKHGPLIWWKYVKYRLSVCVFILFHLLASSGCTTSVTYVRGRINDILLWVFGWVLLPSPTISVSEPILFHLRRRKLQPAADWRDNEWYNATLRKDDILI